MAKNPRYDAMVCEGFEVISDTTSPTFRNSYNNDAARANNSYRSLCTQIVFWPSSNWGRLNAAAVGRRPFALQQFAYLWL